jgi:D-alanyl-D-alanine endopeptidase (penicillin-binding protein 7)
MVKFALSALISACVLLAPVSDSSAAERKRATAVKKFKKPAKKVALMSASVGSGQKIVRRVITVKGKRRVVYTNVPLRPVARTLTAGDLSGLNLTRDPLDLASSVAFVLDESSSEVLFEKNANVALPIASITKLMTGYVVVKAGQDLDEILTITEEDVDRLKHTGSRLKVGTRLSRRTMLNLALMSSENRAASALGRHYPGGIRAFVDAMNDTAEKLGMKDTYYVDSSGLSAKNVASARDLAKLVTVASQEPLLREYSTTAKQMVNVGGRNMQFGSTNYLVSLPDWNIGLQKTGFINEAGKCLVMQAVVAGRNVVMVFLDSKGRSARTADAGRMRKWLEAVRPSPVQTFGQL